MLPPILRARIEHTLRDANAETGGTEEASILLYAFADLDDAFRLAQTWVALGPAHVAVASAARRYRAANASVSRSHAPCFTIRAS